MEHVEFQKRSETTSENETSGTFGWFFLVRFFRLHRLLFVKLISLSSGLFLFVLLVTLLQEYVGYHVGLLSSKYYSVLQNKDLEGFWRETWRACGLIVSISIIKSTKEYLQNVLYALWRMLLTRSIHREYFSEIQYFKLNVVDKVIDNPDQRITQDIQKFCSTYCEILPKILAFPFVLGFYARQSFIRAGWEGPLGCFLFFVAGSTLNKAVMTPIVRYVMEQEKCEGNFRFLHVLIRVKSESLAFHDGASIESTNVDSSLKHLIKTQRKLFLRKYLLQFCVSLFDYFGAIFSYFIIAIPLFNGAYDDEDLISIISESSFVNIYLIFVFSTLIDISDKMTDVAGTSHRIAQLLERMTFLKNVDGLAMESTKEEKRDYEKATKEKSQRAPVRANLKLPHLSIAIAETKTTYNSEHHDLVYSIDNVTLCTPKSKRVLIKDLNLRIRVNESWLITGASSAGKTSFLRFLRGLWLQTNGSLTQHMKPGPREVLFCPQNVYLTIGTLRQQICFPLTVNMCSHPDNDSRIMHYVNVLNLDHVFSRIGSLDVPVPWEIYDSLSPGEMQRLSFLRVFFHRPPVVVLDEATSALSVRMENVVYSECRQLGITIISAGHRESLKQYHEKELHLHSDGGWTVSDLH